MRVTFNGRFGYAPSPSGQQQRPECAHAGQNDQAEADAGAPRVGVDPLDACRKEDNCERNADQEIAGQHGDETFGEEHCRTSYKPWPYTGTAAPVTCDAASEAS